MTEHTYHVPEHSTRFDSGDELHLHAASQDLGQLEAARALVRRTEAMLQERKAEAERTPQAEIITLGHEIADARQSRQAA